MTADASLEEMMDLHALQKKKKQFKMQLIDEMCELLQLARKLFMLT